MIDKDKVIQLAKEAGWPEMTLSMLADTEDMARLGRFYAAAYRQGLEDAARACIDAEMFNGDMLKNSDPKVTIAAAIRSLKESTNG